MAPSPISRVIAEELKSNEEHEEFLTRSTWARRVRSALLSSPDAKDSEPFVPPVADFVLGNPHENPLPGFVDALQRGSVPQNKDWFSYKLSEPSARSTVAGALRSRYGIDFQAEDVAMTNGAFAALGVTLRAILDPGDEAIFCTPPWFHYDTLIRAATGVSVRVALQPPRFDLDVEAIARAITPRTRAVIVNSPNNPTGRVYPAEQLEQLGRALREASARLGRVIYLLSDEAYSRVVFDGRTFQTPTAYYDASFLIYTYGKSVLTPGERIGYVAMHPGMPERPLLRNALRASQFATGWAFPNATLQHAIGDLEKLAIDVGRMQRKRDRMVSALRAMGYEVEPPEATFYLLIRSPDPDDAAFTERLAARDVFVLPGRNMSLPGYVRVCLTATEEMIERSLPHFEVVIQQERKR